MRSIRRCASSNERSFDAARSVSNSSRVTPSRASFLALSPTRSARSAAHSSGVRPSNSSPTAKGRSPELACRKIVSKYCKLSRSAATVASSSEPSPEKSVPKASQSRETPRPFAIASNASKPGRLAPLRSIYLSKVRFGIPVRSAISTTVQPRRSRSARRRPARSSAIGLPLHLSKNRTSLFRILVTLFQIQDTNALPKRPKEHASSSSFRCTGHQFPCLVQEQRPRPSQCSKSSVGYLDWAKGVRNP